ncbi:hypothetical protein [Agrobacterium cavarae]|uniref:hypothetical protein n=1 Tax=Agrobacterium cavarae TaxID=2528239 RepID=UPI0028AE2869|nr:hypothetical protein [Agrobacterium cavarae]
MATATENHGQEERDDAKSVYVSGGFLRNTSIIQSTSMSISFGFGTIPATSERSETKVLMPFVAFDVTGRRLTENSSEEDAVSLLSATLPLENAAYTIWDMAYELADAVKELSDFPQAAASVLDTRRIRATRDLLLGASQKLEQCFKDLERLEMIETVLAD